MGPPRSAMRASAIGNQPRRVDAFSDPGKKRFYVAFLNDYSERVLPGTDFLASRDKDIDVYRTELRITSGILRDLNDTAFRNIGCN